MKELFNNTSTSAIKLVSSDKEYVLRLHSDEVKFVIIDEPGDKFVFDNFDDALKHAKKDGYEPNEKELINFLTLLVQNRNDAKELKLGKYEIFKQISNKVIFDAIEKYGIESKQVEALMKLYKD